MQKIYDISHNIGRYVPKNRIDGIMIGNSNEWLKNIFFKTKEKWQIYIVGEISCNDGLFYQFENIPNEYYSIIDLKNKSKILEILIQSKLEILYIFDEYNVPMFLIDDYPEDVTVNLEFL